MIYRGNPAWPASETGLNARGALKPLQSTHHINRTRKTP
jgi:hypothetical protein